MNYSLFVSCPRGLEYLLEEELKTLNLVITRVSPQGVYGEASLSTLYNICLCTRIANRVQLILFSGYAGNERVLHQLCTQFHWQTVFSQDKTIAIEFHGSSEHFRNTMYGAQVVKDGIVDHFRQFGARPSVDKEKPQILIHAYLKNDEITVSFDLTGYSLHQRGYRSKSGNAPLKENVAAAMLFRARWPELAAQGYAFHDPFCGAGTLVIEAAMMAARIAPGLLRQDQSLQYWAQHQSSFWEKIRAELLKQVKPSSPTLLLGTDADTKMIPIARANAERAGVAPLVEFKSLLLKDARATMKKGLLIGNPPYGERLSEVTHLIPLYQQLGKVAHDHYKGWQAGILTSNPILAKAIGLRASKQYTLYNGALECKLYCFDINGGNQLKDTMREVLSENAQMLLNRLKKNYRHLQKWAKKNDITCYRIYDADLSEYAYAIDIYNDHVVLQEYVAPVSIPVHKAEKRSLEVMQVVPKALNLESSTLVVKQRKQQKGNEQYQKLGKSRKTMIVMENKAKFIVNLYDYLDTGLFLDHRPLRLSFAQLAPGTRFLNCFCYTASASVHAALAGALTTNVDLSNTYLCWAEENFKLNHLDVSKHQFVSFDCQEWMKITPDRFDVIFLDPPTFSNSKRMADTLDIQRDHVALINAAMRLLNPGGTLYFSTNLRQFKLDSCLREHYSLQDITALTIDQDFKRNKKIHLCYKIMSGTLTK